MNIFLFLQVINFLDPFAAVNTHFLSTQIRLKKKGLIEDELIKKYNEQIKIIFTKKNP